MNCAGRHTLYQAGIGASHEAAESGGADERFATIHDVGLKAWPEVERTTYPEQSGNLDPYCHAFVIHCEAARLSPFREFAFYSGCSLFEFAAVTPPAHRCPTTFHR